ncbi:Alpha/Beta hydrolase protein [Xylaria grammica]|nr:Alpha/Beta hydrolase protein [Xylaria grammica]
MTTYGLIPVHDSNDAKVDIVFLHGLRGDISKTWTKDGVVWPRDLLPKDIPESRVFLFGYDSAITHLDQSSVAKTEIHSDANDLCAKLADKRSATGTENRPIIFVAHSLGGLVAAQVLIHGEQMDEGSAAKAVAKNLRGLIFLGTPFRGSSSARPVEIARKILALFGANTQEHTLKLLGVDSDRLDELTRGFSELLNKRRMSKEAEDRIEALFCYETLPTKSKSGLSILSVQIVEPYSAQLPGCGDATPIRASHVDICKFATSREEGYEVVIARIRKMMLPPGFEPPKGSKVIQVLGKAVNVTNEHIIINGGQTNNL